MTDVFTLVDPTITIDMDTFKVTATWQLPPPMTHDPNVTESITHIITLDLGKAVVQDLQNPAEAVEPKQSDETPEG